MKSQTFTKAQYEEIGKMNTDKLRKASSHINSLWKAEILRTLVNISEVHSIIEFGCGAAEVSRLLTQGFQIEKYVGIDISHTQLMGAKTQWPTGCFIVGDESTLTIVQKKYDLSLLIDIIEHVQDPPDLLFSVAKISKYVGIKVPLEDTRFNRILTAFKLKKPESRRYKSAGHIHEWKLQDIFRILSKAKLKPINWRVLEPPKDVLFNLPTMEIMQRKQGIKAKINTQIYKSLYYIFPFALVSALYSCWYGKELFMLCEPEQN